MTRRACVIGSGAREHALAHALSRTADVVVTPGSDAMRAERVEVTDRPDGLILRIGSFTAPAVRLRLSPEERALWRARLTGVSR